MMDTTQTGKFEVRTNLENEIISCLNFNKDGAELVVGCESGTIYQLDTFSLKILSKLEPSEHQAIDVIYRQFRNLFTTCTVSKYNFETRYLFGNRLYNLTM